MVQVQNARDKLQGRHPSEILIAELAPKHSSTKHWAALQVSLYSKQGIDALCLCSLLSECIPSHAVGHIQTLSVTRKRTFSQKAFQGSHGYASRELTCEMTP